MSTITTGKVIIYKPNFSVNTVDNISFDIIYSDSTVPTDLDVEFNDVKVFIRPIGFAV